MSQATRQQLCDSFTMWCIGIWTKHNYSFTYLKKKPAQTYKRHPELHYWSSQMSCLAVILKVHSEVLRSAEQTVPSQQGQQSFKLFDVEIDGDVHLDEPKNPCKATADTETWIWVFNSEDVHLKGCTMWIILRQEFHFIFECHAYIGNMV